MIFDQILGDLNNKIYYPVYFFSGEEPYYIDTLSNYIEKNVLDEQEKEFNQTVVYGQDVKVLDLISIARRFPMMANYQVVIVKEAQDIDKIEELLSYIEKPLSSTLLVLDYKYKRVDKRKKFFKAIANSGVLFESKKVYENKIPAWISGYLAKRSYGITPKASAMLSEFLGTDLSKIVNELNKLIINIPEKAMITDELVEQNIGISKDFNVFELRKAIGARDVLKANRIIHYFAANTKENPLIKTLAILFPFFTSLLFVLQSADKSKNGIARTLGISPFFAQEYQVAARNYSIAKVAKIIGYLRAYDMKAKGVDNVSTPESGLQQELLFKILH